MTAQVIRIDRRVETVLVKRSALAVAAENALAANQSARDAVAAAEQAVWAGNRAAVLHALGRIARERKGQIEAALAIPKDQLEFWTRSDGAVVEYGGQTAA